MLTKFYIMLAWLFLIWTPVYLVDFVRFTTGIQMHTGKISCLVLAQYYNRVFFFGIPLVSESKFCNQICKTHLNRDEIESN